MLAKIHALLAQHGGPFNSRIAKSADSAPQLWKMYLSCIATLLDFRQSDEDLTQDDLTVQSIADYLLSRQRSAVQDRAPRRVSPLTSLKALRWFAKLAEWQELAECTTSPRVASYGHSATCKDKRESYPVPLALVVAFEKCVCDVSAVASMALFLGVAALAVWTSDPANACRRKGCAQKKHTASVSV